jgi:hypothetical protein
MGLPSKGEPYVQIGYAARCIGSSLACLIVRLHLGYHPCHLQAVRSASGYPNLCQLFLLLLITHTLHHGHTNRSSSTIDSLG